MAYYPYPFDSKDIIGYGWTPGEVGAACTTGCGGTPPNITGPACCAKKRKTYGSTGCVYVNRNTAPQDATPVYVK